MKEILFFEIKKIIQRKSTWVAFLLLLAVQAFLAIMGSLGTTTADGVLVETHAERNRIDREFGLELSGRNIDDTLLTEMQTAYAKIADMKYPEYLLSEVYQSEVRKYAGVYELVRSWTAGAGVSALNVSEEDLYRLQQLQREEMYESYELSEDEIEYWEEKAEELPDRFVYQYSVAYEYLINMSGIYMTCMLITFFISISMVNVFMEEHNKKTDQLILCARHGRGKLFFAKVTAGSIVIFICTLIMTIVAIVGKFISFGPEGFGAIVQPFVGIVYPYDLSAGTTLIIMTVLLLLSSVLTAIITMLLAEMIHNSIGAMAVIVGVMFAARMIMIPNSWRVLSQLWNYIPINLLKADQGFTDFRLISIFGLQFTSWQFAPVLYVLVGGLFIFIGKKVYCSSQITGR